MSDIQLEDLEEKYKICEAAVDRSKECSNCRHFDKSETDYPCNECFSALLGLPVTATKWEKL